MRKRWTISKHGVLQLAKKKVAKATFISLAKHLDVQKKWSEIFLLHVVLISHYNPQYFNQFDHNASEKLEIDECVKNEWTRGMSGLKIKISIFYNASI